MKPFLSMSLLLVSCLAPVAKTQADSRVTREGPYWVRTISGTITGSPLLGLRVNVIGAVTVRGAGNDRVEYTFKARAKTTDQKTAETLLRQLELKAGRQADTAYLLIPFGAAISDESELSVTVPRALRQAWIDTRGGGIQAAGLDGELEARSAAGKIVVDDVRGSAELRTGGGDIQVGSVGGGLRCFSGGGTIRVDKAGGESWLETAGGEIFVHQAMAAVHATAGGGNIRIERVSGPVFANTAGGLIQVQQADGAVTAESSGGAIQVNAANGVQCNSAGGAIRLRNVAGAVRASTNSGSIMAELLPGHPIQDSMLSTRAGDITVLIPSDIRMTVSARNGSSGTAGRIISDFPEIGVRASGQQMGAVAEGSLNGGGPVLHINDAGGAIYLRRRK